MEAKSQVHSWQRGLVLLHAPQTGLDCRNCLDEDCSIT